MPLTPDEFNKLVLKDDLKKFKEELKEELMEDNRKNTDKVLRSNDELMAELKKNGENFTMNQAAHDRFEKRIGVLEEKTGISPVSV